MNLILGFCQPIKGKTRNTKPSCQKNVRDNERWLRVWIIPNWWSDK